MRESKEMININRGNVEHCYENKFYLQTVVISND